MKQNVFIDKINSEVLQGREIPEFVVGDTIEIGVRVVEGEKSRVQIFSGIVIARKGSGASESISVYRVSHGSGVERSFPLYSPIIESIKVVRQGDVRRAKLYHLRGTFGKKAKVKERIVKKKT